MTQASRPPIAVIGAGIVGACAAACLQRDGHDVMLIEPDSPGGGASSGNGGMLSGSSIVPVATPGVAAKVPKWLLDREGPLTIRWGYLPRIAPWLCRFLRSATPERVRASAAALRALLEPSLENYAPLVREAGAERLVHREGMLYLYGSEASWRNDLPNTELRRRNGVVMQDVIGAALHDLEPDLGPGLTHGRLVEANGHVADPEALVRALVSHALERGAMLVRERAVGFEHNGSAVSAVVTEQGRHPASRVVLACGAWSLPLARQLGDAVPLDTERGYHIEVARPEKGPRRPTLFVDGNFGATPMERGLRFTGTVEFAGLNAPPNWRRADVLLVQGRRLYPGLHADGDAARLTRWLGFRPSMPDSLPVIGPSSRFGNAFHAFGHGHVGLCAASTTGCLVADWAAGRAPCVPIEPFSPRRFG